jgi:hypothetical protein
MFSHAYQLDYRHEKTSTVTGISQKGKRTYLTDRHEKTPTVTGISQKGKRTYLTDRHENTSTSLALL